MASKPERQIRQMLNAAPIRIAELTGEIVFLSRSLDFEHEDPADRFLAATAKAYGVPFATDDKNLRRLKWLKTV